MSIRRLLRGRFLPRTAVFLVLFAWPLLYHNSYLVTVFMIAGTFAIMALGVNVVNGQTGQGSLGHAAFAGIGGYTAALLSARLNWPPLATIALAAVVAGVVAYILGRPVLRLKLWFLTIATLALVFIFGVLVSTLRGFTGGDTGVPGIPWFNVGSFKFDTYQKDYYLIWIVVLGVLLFSEAFLRSRSGRALRAISANEVAASSLGINTSSWKLRAFVFGSALCGMAGGFYVFFLSNATPTDFNFHLVITIVLMIIIGGQASLLASVIGALLITYAQYSLSSLQQYSSGLYGLVFILVMIFFPGGFVGIPAQLRSDRLRPVRVLFWRMLGRPSAETAKPTLASAQLAASMAPRARGVRPIVDMNVPNTVAQRATGPQVAVTGGRMSSPSETGLAASRPAGRASLDARAVAPLDQSERPEPVIRIENVTVDFRGLQAVSHVSLEMMPGAVSAIIGPNGAGKTTLFNVLNGLQGVSTGHVWFKGKDLTRMRSDQIARLGVARTFQNLRIFGNMTVLDNVMTGRHMHERSHFFTAGVRWPSQRREERGSREAAMRIIDFVGLAERAEDHAASLPYGQQRLTEIARALAAEPALILLDEPAAGMNQSEREMLVQKIQDISDSGIKVILVEHNMGVVMGISHQVAVLDHGALICEGDPETVQCDARVIEAYLGAGRSVEMSAPAQAGPTEVTVRAPLVEEEAPSLDGNLLEIQGISTYYGVIGAVRDVSLKVKPGEVLAVLGANGAGKTTLMRTISGVLRPRSGRVIFEGRDITHMSPPRIVEVGISQVPEGRHVFPTLSVYDNLMLGAGRLHHKGVEYQEALDAVFELFPRLHERRKQAAGSLSGGEQQMLAVARGLMAHPRLLMLDEPSMGLAPVVVAAIFESLQVLNDRGLTLLMVEQNAEAALAIADRAVVMVTGEIALAGTAIELKRDPRVRALYLGGEADEVVA